MLNRNFLNQKTIHASLLSAVLLLSGCASKTLVEEQKKPTELKDIVAKTTVLQQKWRFDADADTDFYRLEVSEDDEHHFYIASKDGVLHKLDQSGKSVWRIDTKKTIISGTANNNKIVVVADDKAFINAYDAQNGQVLWAKQLKSSVLAPALVTENRVVLLANNGLMTGLDAKTGNIVWQFKIKHPEYSLRGTAKPVRLSKKYVAFATADGRVHALTIKDGIPQWVRSVSLSSGKTDFDRLMDVDADPLFEDMKLYTSGFQSQVIGIDMISKSELFQRKISSTKTPALSGELLMVVDNNSKVHAINAKTGETVWAQENLLYRKLSNPVTINDKVFVGDFEGFIHVLDANNGTIIARYNDDDAVVNLAKTSQNELISTTNSGSTSLWQVQ